MKRIILVLAICLVASVVRADEPYVLTVPGQGWGLRLSLPPLSQYQAEDSENGFRFMGASSTSGVIISVFVEPSSAADSEACRAELWASGSQNPMIVKETVQLRELGKNPGVVYVLEGDLQGQQVKSQNTHVYIANSGRCVDLHLSRFPFAYGAREQLAAIAKSVAIQPLQ